VRNIAVNSNCTACVDTDIVPCSAASASSRHVLSANNYITESGKCDVICMRFSAVGFLPLPEISGTGISIVMYVFELFVDGKCIIGSLVRRTFTTGHHLLFYTILTCRILPQPQIRGFQYSFLDYSH